MKKPKLIAFYLPQFHQVKENDEWWGEGFTDWESARKAKPLYCGHYQPREPLHNNYYNLLNKESMVWQAKIAKKTGIYGFCMYHYWFGDNKQILEKPAENLLKWKDIDINYCFSWANESWITSWSNIPGNAWTDSSIQKKGENSKGILLEQKYGKEKEWEKHFMYLLPFFKDDRYIKKDGKPIFVIYMPDKIPQIKQMINYWNDLAKMNNIPGIYVIGTCYLSKPKRGLDARLLFEPGYSIYCDKYKKSIVEHILCAMKNILRKRNIAIPTFMSYKAIWKKIVSRKIENRVYPGCFVGYDASPRKGNSADIIYGGKPREFKKYFSRLYSECKKAKSEFLFITAWNEWGEGSYLEPDKKYGYSYLKIIRDIVCKE